MKENEWIYFKDTKILAIKIDKMVKNNGQPVTIKMGNLCLEDTLEKGY